MRLRWTSLLIALGLSGCAQSPGALAHTPEENRCEAAEVALKAYLEAASPPHVFSPAPPEFSPRLYTMEFLRGGWTGERPDERLLGSLLEEDVEAAFRCPNLTELAATEGLKLEEPPPIEGGELMGWPLYHRFGLPIVDADKDDALALVTSSAPRGLAGVQRLLFLRRERGAWKVIGWKALAIS